MAKCYPTQQMEDKWRRHTGKPDVRLLFSSVCLSCYPKYVFCDRTQTCLVTKKCRSRREISCLRTYSNHISTSCMCMPAAMCRMRSVPRTSYTTLIATSGNTSTAMPTTLPFLPYCIHSSAAAASTICDRTGYRKTTSSSVRWTTSARKTTTRTMSRSSNG